MSELTADDKLGFKREYLSATKLKTKYTEDVQKWLDKSAGVQIKLNITTALCLSLEKVLVGEDLDIESIEALLEGN